MSAVDEYLASVDENTRTAFEHIRRLALEVAPEADEGQSYGMAALLYRRKPLLGFRAAARHLSVFPFSPAVIEQVHDQLIGFDVSKGTIRFTVDKPLPDEVVREIVRRRVAEIG